MCSARSTRHGPSQGLKLYSERADAWEEHLTRYPPESEILACPRLFYSMAKSASLGYLERKRSGPAVQAPRATARVSSRAHFPSLAELTVYMNGPLPSSNSALGATVLARVRCAGSEWHTLGS